jgi:phosphohistidine phosphatase
MRVYFLRHAVAAERGTVVVPNDDRVLTKDGIRKMKKEARSLPSLIPRVDVILTSPFSRAKETAGIAAEALSAAHVIKESSHLAPGKPAREVLKLLGAHAGMNSVLLVGHEPQLSAAISLLLGIEKPVVEMKKGGMCCLELRNVVSMKGAQLIWHLTPKQLRALGK